MDQTTIKTIKKYLTRLPNTIVVDQMVVFGSRARGDYRENSDIDVAIVSQNFNDMSEVEQSRLLYKATTDIYPEIHPWGFTPKEFNTADKQSSIGSIREQGLRVTL
jgi:predicted nucleotidyltransferase